MLSKSDRRAARNALLTEIEALQHDFQSRKERMMAEAIATGHTSQVRTVRAIETALNVAYERVKKL